MTAAVHRMSRAARAELTREHLVEAARLLFAECGYRSVSLRDIAREAGVSHPALLRHFSGKQELLAHALSRVDEEAGALTGAATGPRGELAFSAVAARNDAIPGYLPLFAGLVGEASVAGHPAHDTMRAHGDRFLHAATAAIIAAARGGAVGPGRHADGEAVRLMAAWDCLQVMQLYLPDRVDTAAAVARHERLLAFPAGWREPAAAPGARGWTARADRGGEGVRDAGADRDGERGAGAGTRSTSAAPPPNGAEPESPAGYRTGRARRARILDDAMTLFAQEGYADTSLREIAARVGVSKSALYHHFPSKDALLLAVLEERDRRIDAATAALQARGAAARLRALPLSADENAHRQPGLVEVYAVLSCEAIPATHPAHAHFARRFARALDTFEALLRAAAAAGDLSAHRDPAHEAAWLLALWDGLQYRWLYDRDGIDVGAHLRAHLRDVLPGEGAC